jgi:hypothetical protein
MIHLMKGDVPEDVFKSELIVQKWEVD